MSEVPAVGSIVVSKDGLNPVTNFHYPNAKFTKTEFVEFPKWIHMIGYESVLAADAAEEAVLRARPPIVQRTVRPIISSHPIIMRNGVQVVAPTPVIKKVWWKRMCLWLSIKLEELSR